MACHVESGTSDASVCAKKCLNAEISRLKGTHELHCTYQDAISYDVELGAKGKIILRYGDLPRMY